MASKVAIVWNWIPRKEAMRKLAMSKNTFLKTAAQNGLSVSALGGKTYYRVDQLQSLFENNIIIK